MSRDHGETLQKKCLVLKHIAGENRDPMVFWHEASNAYCMVLYLEENTFAVFRSRELLHFEETQRLELPKAWECPALFPLPVEGEEGKNGFSGLQTAFTLWGTSMALLSARKSPEERHI